MSAADPDGGRWKAATPRNAPFRLLAHVLVLAAVSAPVAVTAASAHPAPVEHSRIQVSAQPIDHPELIGSLPASVSTPSPQPTGLALLAVTNPPAAVPAVAGGAGYHFPPGWCTYYVSTRRYIPWSGDAITWWGSARALGWPTGSKPMVGAIMVTRESGWGHVAYVEAVDGTCWTVSEMNYKGFGIVDRRHICPGQVPLVGFIY